MIKLPIDKKLRPWMRKRIWRMFLESGQSTHSAQSWTVGIIINACERYQIPYVFQAQPGIGYHIELCSDIIVGQGRSLDAIFAEAMHHDFKTEPLG